MSQEIQKVPNQRVISVNKAPTDKEHLYTPINLQVLEYAAGTLQSKVGLKLWLYIAQNTHKYTFALSSKDFCEWAKCSRTAYNTAFDELVKKGFLINTGIGQDRYSFAESGGITIKSRNQQTPKKDNEFLF